MYCANEAKYATKNYEEDGTLSGDMRQQQLAYLVNKPSKTAHFGAVLKLSRNRTICLSGHVRKQFWSYSCNSENRTLCLNLGQNKTLWSVFSHFVTHS